MRKNYLNLLRNKIIWLGLLLGGCAEITAPENVQELNTPSVMSPQGYGAAEIAVLWWIILAIAVAVFVVVTGLLLAALLRRRDEAHLVADETRDRILVVGGGIIVPFIILVGVYFLTLNTMAALANNLVAETVVIKVIGHQWWWEVQYPNQEVTTANEIYIPVGEPVRLEVESADVIHSFWVPELHGKIDMIPGQTNIFTVQADEAGVYFGACAEFCGTQHAKMAFIVVATPPERFAAWLNEQSQPAAEPVDPQAEEGLQVFLQAGCGQCHTVAGTPATGTAGPDLTHLASRRSLAAGMLPNTRGNLGGWVMDPQGIKPGSLMPPSDLTGAELQVLLAYLESLE